MRVFLTGGTGMIGRRLVQILKDRGDTPVILSRNSDETRRNPALRGIQVIQGDPGKAGPWQDALDGVDAVSTSPGTTSLPGAGTLRSNDKFAIAESTGPSTSSRRSVGEGSPQGADPGVGDRLLREHGDEELTESSPSGSDFLAVVCRELEDAARQVEPLGVRLATLRTGVVLARGEGALGVMTPPLPVAPWRSGPGGEWRPPFRPATGRQWLSWIHVDDILGLFLLALDNPDAQGGSTARLPTRSATLISRRLWARVLHRPFLPFGPPDLVLEVAMGGDGQGCDPWPAGLAEEGPRARATPSSTPTWPWP